jgi:hypothetical protein
MEHDHNSRKRSFFKELLAMRWPVFLGAILSMSVLAQGIMVYHATSKEAPLPQEKYYEKAEAWDKSQAELESSRKLGWTVSFAMPSGPQYVAGSARPVDVLITDNKGELVRGLTGKFLATHPSESRLNASGQLTELPQEPGHYRVLIPFPIGGLWDFHLDMHKGQQPFVHSERFIIRTGRDHQ